MTEPEILIWKGHKVYRCRLCAFDSLDKAQFEDHFRKRHAPFRIIEGQQDTAGDLHKMTRDELNAEAARYAIDDPGNTETYPTKADLIAAIEAAQKG